MSIKSTCVFVLALVALVTAQLPFNRFNSDVVLPGQWVYESFDILGFREGDMLIADVTDSSNADVQVFAQFDRNPTATDFWNFNFYSNVNNGAFERVFAVIYNGEVSAPANASTVVFGIFNANNFQNATVNWHFYSKPLIDVVIGESRVVHLDEGQYQFFRYDIDPMFTDGNYLLRIETVAVNGDIISFRGRTQFPIGVPTIGFTHGIPAVDEPGLSYVGLSADVQTGLEYAGVANLDPPGDLEDESSDVTMSFSYAQSYTINPSTTFQFEETYSLHPNSWLYLTIPNGGSNNVFVLETVTAGPLMLPLLRRGGFPSATYHDGWLQRTIVRELDEADDPIYTFKAVSDPINTNTVVGYLNTDTIEIRAAIRAHFAIVRDVRLGDSFDNENLNRSGMWRFYRFQSTESDENALLQIVFSPDSGSSSNIYYFIGGFPTSEQNLPWQSAVTRDGSTTRTLTIPLSLNTIYHIGVVNSDTMDASNPATYSISFNRATRPSTPVDENQVNNNNTVSTALIVLVVILACTTLVGIIAVIILAIQRKKEKEALASGEGPNYARLVDQQAY